MAEFGSVFIPKMALATFENNQWTEAEIVDSDSIQLHPGAHVLHYSSTCFEGLKAFKHQDGSVHIFRMDQNIARLAQSSRLLSLPNINEKQVSKMIIDIVTRYASDVPDAPGAMYIRPTHIGTEAAIGKASSPTVSSMLYVLLSPVGDYFANGARALTLLLDEDGQRCAPHMGMVKSGGNYASALTPTLKAKKESHADQVLFCPNGYITESAAANFLLIDGNEIITKGLDSSFLHGVTRSSILTIAADMGMKVSERELSIVELLERSEKHNTEAILSGTAAVVTSVGSLIHKGCSFKIGSGEIGPVATELRQRLNDIQWGKAQDKHNWLTQVA